MPLGNSSVQWDTRLPVGSKWAWTLSMYQSDGVTPFVIAGHTFEYVIRSSPADTGTPLVRLRSDVPGSPIPSGGGLLAVVSTSVQAAVQLTLYPPGTSSAVFLTVPGTYYHALWMDYASPQNAMNLFWGQFMLDAAAQS